jgi:hypothetical protein
MKEIRKMKTWKVSATLSGRRMEATIEAENILTATWAAKKKFEEEHYMGREILPEALIGWDYKVLPKEV